MKVPWFDGVWAWPAPGREAEAEMEEASSPGAVAVGGGRLVYTYQNGR